MAGTPPPAGTVKMNLNLPERCRKLLLEESTRRKIAGLPNQTITAILTELIDTLEKGK